MSLSEGEKKDVCILRKRHTIVLPCFSTSGQMTLNDVQVRLHVGSPLKHVFQLKLIMGRPNPPHSRKGGAIEIFAPKKEKSGGRGWFGR